uniref:Uncharacterized protein LOC102801679 n=1 Tax=Saccoglossus kowalevskii TaxID=10224 RepID=A0ABM0MLF2_SACKO|nr:PREDICTED: uncharacterized protein LOC102801679 [Saccoglossus kowalevskii]
MVDMDIFDEVLLNFLPVGHTHENVDQLFSKVATELNKANTYTLNDLESLIMRAYTPTVCFRSLQQKPIINIKEWLIPHISDRIQGHSKPLNFRFYKMDGTTFMQYRQWSTNPWEPSHMDVNGQQVPGLKCLQSVPELDDVPAYVLPSIEKLDIESLKRDLPYSCCLRMPASASQWWNEYLHNIKDLEKVPDEAPIRWLLHDLKNAADEKRATRRQMEEDP